MYHSEMNTRNTAMGPMALTSFVFTMRSSHVEIEQFHLTTVQTRESIAGLVGGRGQMESQTPAQWFLDEATSPERDETRKRLQQWSA